MNEFGEPIVGHHATWERAERGMLKFEPRVLTPAQMILIERLIPEICVRGAWNLHACAAGPDHVHNILTPLDWGHGADGKAVRKWLKRWLSELLVEHIPLLDGETFWAECGSVKWVWTEDYFLRAVDYVRKQRATGRAMRGH
jgi:REP element-mobilizing transposase RayT